MQLWKEKKKRKEGKRTSTLESTFSKIPIIYTTATKRTFLCFIWLKEFKGLGLTRFLPSLKTSKVRKLKPSGSAGTNGNFIPEPESDQINSNQVLYTVQKTLGSYSKC